MISASNCLIVESSASIKEVMKKMSQKESQYALLVNKDKKLVGIVTDGDFRRAISSGFKIDDFVSTIMNKNPKTISLNEYSSSSYALLNNKFKYIPVIKNDFSIHGVISKDEINFNVNINNKNVCVIGMGYVGLTLSLIMAESGYNVYGYEKNLDVVNKLKNHKATFYESGIETYIKRFINKELKIINKLEESQANTFIISVGTPLDQNQNIPNINYISEVIEEISKVLKKNDLIILRSTVPVGTTRNIVKNKLEELTNFKCGKEFYLAFAPERTIEGDALNEIKSLPQILGAYDKVSLSMADQIFSEFANNIIKVDDLESAEMIKIMNNTYRDVKFGYSNEMALVCKDLGLDMNRLVLAANNGYTRDKIPLPSPGVGGPCLPKDAKILSYSIKKNDRPVSLISAARLINESIVTDIYNEVQKYFNQIKKVNHSSKFLVLGIAFKGNPPTSDLRGSNSIDLLNLLLEKGIKKNQIYIYDPVVSDSDLVQLGFNMTNLEEGFENADAVFIMNNHDTFYNLDIYNLLKIAKDDCIFFDGWYFFEPTKVTSINNIKYLSVGTKNV